MAGQICKTCKHRNDWCYCSPNSICFDYEEDTKVDDFVKYAKEQYNYDIVLENEIWFDAYKEKERK